MANERTDENRAEKVHRGSKPAAGRSAQSKKGVVDVIVLWTCSCCLCPLILRTKMYGIVWLKRWVEQVGIDDRPTNEQTIYKGRA